MDRREMLQEVVGSCTSRLYKVLPLLVAPGMLGALVRPALGTVQDSQSSTGSPAFPSAPEIPADTAADEPSNPSEVNTCNSHVATS
jgi:hypothetical protein